MVTKKEKYPKNQVALAHFAKALAHPSRLLIMKFLEINTTCSFGTISSVLPISKASTAQHLTVLKDSGLVNTESIPPHMYYSINKKAWKEAQLMFSTFFSPISRTEYEAMAEFLSNNTPDLIKIALEALETDRKLVEDRLAHLQKNGLIDSSLQFSKMSYEELREVANKLGVPKAKK